MKKGTSALLKQSLLAATGLFIASSGFSSAQAASLSFTLDEFTGSNAQVNVTLDDSVAADTVRFTLAVNSANTGNIGDIVGVFFNLNNDALIPNLNLTPKSANPGKFPFSFNLDQSGSTTDNNEDVDNNVNLNGNGDKRTFDAAVQIGKGGLQGGKDDYQTISFDLSAAGLNLSQFSAQSFGVRLQSVGVGNNREGSSKLAGTVSNNPPKSVPEPGVTTALGLFAVGAAASLKKKKATQG